MDDERRAAWAKAYQARPEVIARAALRQQSPERKAWQKAYNLRPEVQARNKARQATPEGKARARARHLTPEFKAYQAAYGKARAQTPEWKAYQKALQASPEFKARPATKRNAKLRRHRRRAQKARVEVVVHLKVTWCWLCGDALDPTAQYPDLMATEGGHEPPFARLPEEGLKWQVLRPEHKGCNAAKGTYTDQELGLPDPLAGLFVSTADLARRL
jgi:hypothetical protein